MQRRYDADFDEVLLFPPAVEDWLPPDHPARFIREVVRMLSAQGDLGLVCPEGIGGRPAYSGELLLRLWLYGYFSRVTATRRLETACKETLPFMWLVGQHRPDHNTIWRFYNSNKKVLRTLFKKVVELAFESGCIGIALHAVDGTRIQTQSATRTGLHADTIKKHLEKLDTQISALEARVEEQELQAEAADAALPQALQDAKQLRTALEAANEQLAQLGVKHLHPNEDQARIMKVPDRGMNLFGFNAQAVADEQSGLIVAQDVVPNENDLGQLVPMMEQVQENLGVTADLTAADKGYASGADFQAAADKSLPAVVALPEHFAARPEDPYHSSQFTYDAQQNTVTCPRGEQLKHTGQRTRQRSRVVVQIFRCLCQDCPVRHLCSKNKHGREIEIAPFQEALTKQRELLLTEKGKQAIRKRRHIIEPVFAHIKEHMRFRRWTVRGLENVRAQWSLVCTAYNLRKLYACWKAKKLPGLLKTA